MADYVASTEERGTTFVVNLPRSSPAVAWCSRCAWPWAARWRSPGSLVEELSGQMGTITRGYDGARRGRATEVLAATRRGGRRDRLYFDVVTRLPVQLDIWEEGPEAAREPGAVYLAHYDLGDYRTVDGVTMPFYVRRVRPNSTMTFQFTQVRHKRGAAVNTRAEL